MEKLSYILLVDDDDTANYLNQSLLEDLQVAEHILIAHQGAEALDLIKSNCARGNCPQLILLDINMPVMNGFEFLEAYQKLEIAHRQSVVIVMLTTSLNPVDISRMAKTPAVGYLNKPLTEQMIRDLLKGHFNWELPG